MGRKIWMLVVLVFVCGACGSNNDATDAVVEVSDSVSDSVPGPTAPETTASERSDALTGRSDAPSLPGFEPLMVDASAVDGFAVFCGTVELEGGTIDLSQFPVFEGDLSEFVNEQFLPEFELQWEEGLKDIVLHELERSDERLHLLGKSPHSDAGYQEIAFERRNGGWQMETWGGCATPEVVAPGWSISELRLDPEHEPNGESEHLVLWVTERECASGQLPDDRAIAPIVSERSGSVDLLVLIEEQSGDVNCQGNPSFPIVIELNEPLGQRSIRNVAFEPAVELEWPIPLRDSEVWISVVGDAPTAGRANAMLYRGTDYPEGLLLDRRGWLDFGGGPVTGLSGLVESVTIEGFVIECGDDESCLDGGCIVEGDPHADEWLEDGGRWCSDFSRLGETCTVLFDPDPLQDALITVDYADTTCSIEVERTPIG